VTTPGANPVRPGDYCTSEAAAVEGSV